MLTLLWPWAWLLLPLPLLVYFLLPRAGHQDEAALRVPFYQEVGSLDLARREARRRSPWWLALFVMIWILLLAAVSRPQWVGDPVALPAMGRDLLLAVDISGSMSTEDMVGGGRQISRLGLVKKVAGEFINRRVGDRVGLLLFGTRAYLQTPLTFDRQTVKTLLNEAMIGFAGPQTSLGDAIGLAIKHLRERPAKSRVLILLTDGTNTSGSVEPLTAANLAAQTGVKIYTIGIGAEEMVVRTFFGNQRVNPAADLDEDTLEKIAAITGGRYFRARDPEELAKIYQDIDRLEPVEQESEVYRPARALFHIPLALAMLLSFLAALRLAVGNPPRWYGKPGPRV